MTEYYSPRQVADKLGVKPATVRNYVKDDLIPHTRLGGKIIRISDADLDAFLKRYRHGL